MRTLIYLLLFIITGINYWISSAIYLKDTVIITKPLTCISYDPRYRFHKLSSSELKKKFEISEIWIEEDLNKISKVSKCVRTYYASHGMQNVPKIASKYSLSVILGVDITDNIKNNDEEVHSAIQAAKQFSNIRSIIVGNEVLLHNLLGDFSHVPLAELYRQIATVRKESKIPVSTAEPYQTWITETELAAQVDFFAINELPYWFKQKPEMAISHLDQIFAGLNKIDPNKKILLSEVGWPSAGPANGPAAPGQKQAVEFLKRLVEWADLKNIDYNYFEAFDQPWKLTHKEGRVGTQWGIFDTDGKQKFAPVADFNRWILASVIMGFILCLVFTLTRKQLWFWGSLYFYIWAQALAILTVLLTEVSIKQYLYYSLDFWIFIVTPVFVLFCLIFIELLETVKIFSSSTLLTDTLSIDQSKKNTLPFVSIHLACCREPPDMVIATLNSLLALDYPSYEIIVMDNNTLDPELYEPVARFCAQHADKIRFFHEDVLSGYKSGALNYALQKTDPRATIVGVIDSDYLVKPEWLKELVPHFVDQQIAVVQGPQAYRNWEDHLFSTMVRGEYEGFFRIGMVQRNLSNAIIQHGTMLLLRRSVLENVGGWAEWCITEDTELGLRILIAGHRAIYISKVYGEGLIPQSAEAYFKQRFRWVNGAMTILRRYSKELLGLQPGLTRAQRYYFLTGWLPWIVNASAPVFTILGLIGSILCLWNHLYFPPIEIAFPFIVFFIFQLITSLITYSVRVKIGFWRSLLSNIAGMSLTWVIAAATVRGLFGKHLAFYRTQKSNQGEAKVSDSWIWNFFNSHGDLGIALALLFSAFGLLYNYECSKEALAWSSVLFLLSLPPISRGILLASSWWRNA